MSLLPRNKRLTKNKYRKNNRFKVHTMLYPLTNSKKKAMKMRVIRMRAKKRNQKLLKQLQSNHLKKIKSRSVAKEIEIYKSLIVITKMKSSHS